MCCAPRSALRGPAGVPGPAPQPPTHSGTAGRPLSAEAGTGGNPGRHRFPSLWSCLLTRDQTAGHVTEPKVRAGSITGKNTGRGEKPGPLTQLAHRPNLPHDTVHRGTGGYLRSFPRRWDRIPSTPKLKAEVYFGSRSVEVAVHRRLLRGGRQAEESCARHPDSRLSGSTRTALFSQVPPPNSKSAVGPHDPKVPPMMA